MMRWFWSSRNFASDIGKLILIMCTAKQITRLIILLI
ncbi:hypothetical protein LINPERPRIM_LOCUS22192 [Linum perenne]